ncbi:MAG: hypothetical protein GX154_12950 [Clostridiales bacterium]|nr:hypothetical protein [Clostridiales bacterium]
MSKRQSKEQLSSKDISHLSAFEEDVDHIKMDYSLIPDHSKHARSLFFNWWVIRDSNAGHPD